MSIRRVLSKLVLLGVALGLLPAIPAASDDRLIAVTEVWPPFRIEAPKAAEGLTGIDIKLIAELERRLGMEIEIQRHPFARALHMIRQGDADLIPGIAYTEERAEFIRYATPSYYEVGPVFYTQKGHGKEISRYQDLYNHTIGYSLHSAYFEPFNSDTGLSKRGLSTEEQLLKMLASRRLEVIIGTNPNLAYDVKRYGLSGKVEQTDYIPEQKTPIYFGISKRKHGPELQGRIEAALSEMRADGTLQAIIKAYK